MGNVGEPSWDFVEKARTLFGVMEKEHGKGEAKERELLVVLIVVVKRKDYRLVCKISQVNVV